MTVDGQKRTRLSFRKNERLCSNIAISQLLQSGSALNHFPFRLLYLPIVGESDRKSSVQLAIAVPKKKFKRAVDRNLLKRRIREAYRLHKPAFYERLEKQGVMLNLLLVYVSTEIMPYSEIEAKLIKLLERTAHQLEKSADISAGTTS